MGIEIGKIVEVRGLRVRAELYELLPPYLVENGVINIAPRINTYVKTKVGLDTIICQITGEYYDEKIQGQFTGYFLDLTVKGYFENKKFVQGLRMLPMVAASIELMDDDEYGLINGTNAEKSIIIGRDLFDSNHDFFIDYNKIIPSHVGVFGNTGSGKSNTLAKLLSEYCNVINGHICSKILVFDINDEYGENAFCDADKKKIYKLTTRKNDGDKIPFNYDELKEDQWCLLLNAKEATQRPVIKTAFNDKRIESDYEDLLKKIILNKQEPLFMSIRHNLSDYIKGLDNLIWHSTNKVFFINNVNGSIFLDSEERVDNYIKIKVSMPDKKLENFLFKLYFAAAEHIGYGIQYEFIAPLLRRADKFVKDFEKVFDDSCNANIFDNKNIAIVQLSDVNQDMLEVIPALLTDVLFVKQIEAKTDGFVKNIINIVVDEAHNLLYEGEDEFNNNHSRVTLKTFERAIKEGRKFGLYLWISSQRPSDISQTIISQMLNYFIHKLVNPNDIAKIRKAVAYMDENSIDTLTALGKGECIVSGTCVNMPCFVKINQLDEDRRPKSEDVVIFGENGIIH